MVELRAKHSSYNVKIILHAKENIYMPHMARQFHVVVNNWLHKVHHLYRYKVHATLNLCIRDRNMCMRQQLVTNQGIVLLNPTKTTLRNCRFCFYHFCFNYAMMYFCNILDARWSHRMWHVRYLGCLIWRVSNEEPKVHILFILIISIRKMTHKIVSVFIIYKTYRKIRR